MTAYYPNQPGPVLLTQMLNDLLATTFVPDDIVYETPSVIDIDGRNTALSFQVIRGPLRGRRSVCHYKRLDLQTLIGARNIQIEDTGSITSTADLLPIIQNTYGIALTAVDIDDTAITIGAYPVVVNLTAKANSYIIYGSTTVQIVASTGGGGTPDELVTTHNATLSEPFVDVNGDMLVLDRYDNPHSASSFYQQTEGTFLAAVRAYSDWDGVQNPQQGATYNLSGVQDGEGDWFITWVAGLVDPGFFIGSYDVKLRIEATDQPTVPVVNLSLTDMGAGSWALVDAATNLTIPVTSFADGQLFESDFAATKLIGATPEDTSGLNGVARTPDGVPTGEFKINLTVTRKPDNDIVSDCEIFGTVNNWIEYPIDEGNVALGGMFVDVDGFLLAAPTSPDGSFFRSRTETMVMGGRAIGDLTNPTAAVMRDNAEPGAGADLYNIFYDPQNPDGWYVQLTAQIDDVALTAVTAGGPSVVKIAFNGWSDPNIINGQVAYHGNYTPGAGYTFTETPADLGAPNLVPDYVSGDGKLLEFNIPITRIAEYIDPAYLDANDIPEQMSVLFTLITPDGEFPFEKPAVEFYVKARPTLPDFYMAGVNGTTYVYAPSTLPTVDDDTFPSASELGPNGYDQWPFGIYRIVDGVLVVHIGGGVPGYLSDYTGSINNIAIYGCDPVTGNIVQSHYLDPVAWSLNVKQYALPDMPVLSPSLKWRASIEMNLTHTPTEDTVLKTIDTPVLVSDPAAKILSIDGVAVAEPQASLVVSFNSPAYATARLLDITSVVYAMPEGAVEVPDGPHTAVILVNGQEVTINFVAASY